MREQNTTSQKLKILITGGAGFIGAHLARKALSEGCHVTSWDVRDPLNSVSGVEYLHRDVRELENYQNELFQFDLIYHLAAIVSVPLCQKDPVGSFETNVRSTIKLATALRNHSKKIPLIFASSSAVYGALGDQHHQLKEDLMLGAPLSLYAAQKRFCEDVLRNFLQIESRPFLALRFFNIYGEGQDRQSPYSGVMTLYAHAAETNQPIHIFGDGKATRDFVFVDDVVKVCIQLGLMLVDGDPKLQKIDVLNVGSGSTITIEQLADLYLTKSRSDVTKSYGPPRPGDILHSCANIEKLQKITGWTPRPLSQDLLI